jgi:hypothetical protein
VSFVGTIHQLDEGFGFRYPMRYVIVVVSSLPKLPRSPHPPPCPDPDTLFSHLLSPPLVFSNCHTLSTVNIVVFYDPVVLGCFFLLNSFLKYIFTFLLTPYSSPDYLYAFQSQQHYVCMFHISIFCTFSSTVTFFLWQHLSVPSPPPIRSLPISTQKLLN